MINEYLQVLLKVERLDDFNTTDEDIDDFGADLSKQPCAYIEKKFEEKGNPQPGLLARYFRCGFRTRFSGVLKRVFAGIASIKKYEITMIREYHSNKDDFEDCSSEIHIETCFIAEFNLQIDISAKMQNGRTLEQSLEEAMVDLRKDSSIIIKPKPKIPKVPNMEKLRKGKRNSENARNFDSVRILKSSKVKLPGQNAVLFAAVTLTLLFLSFKYVI